MYKIKIEALQAYDHCLICTNDKGSHKTGNHPISAKKLNGVLLSFFLVRKNQKAKFPITPPLPVIIIFIPIFKSLQNHRITHQQSLPTNLLLTKICFTFSSKTLQLCLIDNFCIITAQKPNDPNLGFWFILFESYYFKPLETLRYTMISLQSSCFVLFCFVLFVLTCVRYISTIILLLFMELSY